MSGLGSVEALLVPLVGEIRHVLTPRSPALAHLAQYYFDASGKLIRPATVLLMARAVQHTHTHGSTHTQKGNTYTHTQGNTAEHAHTQGNTHIHTQAQSRVQSSGEHTGSGGAMKRAGVLGEKARNLYEEQKQRRLQGLPRCLETDQRTVAMIAEMIHTASLIHDDVIDAATSRRNKPSINLLATDKECIRAADYLFARTSMLLASLQHTRVVEIQSQIIEDLVKGELMQLSASQDPEARYQNYLRKTYLKTASLLARSCLSVSVLANCSEEVQDIAFKYGKHLGIGFQVIDDVLDQIASTASMGKETHVDMKLGLATAPVLFASEQFPELNTLILRHFEQEGDIERAVELVNKSDGIERARALAKEHCDLAVELVSKLPESKERDALMSLPKKVLSRDR